MPVRDHNSATLEEFNGLWQRGDIEETPLDHFSSCNNVKPIGDKAFGTRDGLGKHQNVASPLGNVVRIYNFVTQDKNTLLVLTYDGTTGKIYHVVDSTTVFGPILTKTGMTDFAFEMYAGRAYISPFISVLTGGLYIEKGMQSEFVYVYKGDGTAARKAAGAIVAGTLTVVNGAAGNTDAGFHIFAVIGETDTGFLTAPFAFVTFTTQAALSVSFSTIPTFVGAQWVKRHIVATKVIPTYNGNTTGYTYYFLPNGTIPDNVTTTLPNISFFDADLLEDASHLLDNYTEIPAIVGMTLYHNRMIYWTTFTDINTILVSAVGEPEAISTIDGLLVIPPDGNPVTNGREMRDVLYMTKRNKTVSFTDNDEAPTSWPMSVIDQGNGAPVHGIATVLDSGSSNIDYLIIASYKGIMLFNGRYIIPELSWKISDLWLSQNRVLFKYIQIINDSILQRIYCTLPDRRLLVGYYNKGLDPEKIQWWPWSFDVTINTIALVNINDLIIGAESRFVG